MTEEHLWEMLRNLEMGKLSAKYVNDKILSELVDMQVLKCCGNCYHMDVLVDKGSICSFGHEEMPCDRDEYCDNWELNKRD